MKGPGKLAVIGVVAPIGVSNHIVLNGRRLRVFLQTQDPKFIGFSWIGMKLKFVGKTPSPLLKVGLRLQGELSR